jgi:hypothetical protein
VSILVNWPAGAAVVSGLLVLLGGTWLLRGARAVVRMCGAVGIAGTLGGVATGKILLIAAGVIILATVCWCSLGLREPGRRRKGGGA